jgi:hypothetical protein
MGIRRGPNIVRDGLVFSVDAANPTSYPGSGVIWKDQTINQNDGTLINGPTFSEDGGGSIVFDGVNDKVIGTNSTLLSFGDGSTDSPFSLSAWIYMDDTSSTSAIMGKYRSYNPFRGEYAFQIDNQKLLFQCVDGSTTIRVRRDADSTLSTSRWYNVAVTYNANGTDEGIVLYVDGEVLPSSGRGQDGAYVAMQRASDPSELTIGVLRDEGNTEFQSNMDGKIANAQIYNKELSSSEILQNYNALKDRFI